MILEIGQTLAAWMGQEAGRPSRSPYRAIYRGVIDSLGVKHERFDTANLEKNMIVMADVDFHADRPRHLILGFDQVGAKETDRVFDILTGETLSERSKADSKER